MDHGRGRPADPASGSDLDQRGVAAGAGRAARPVLGPGATLALALLAGFRTLVDAAIDELDRRGYPDVRPTHDFALRAIAAGADSASELARRLSVAKQSAAKTVAVLQERGYVASRPDPRDARRKRLEVTERGEGVLRTGEAVFDELRERWARRLGAEEFAAFEARLGELVGAPALRFDTPGWLGREGS